MKKNGSNCEFNDARDRALMEAFKHELLYGAIGTIEDICERIVSSPCTRFWVSEERAAIVVSAMIRGEIPKGMLPSKRRMYEEIMRRVMTLRDSRGRASLRKLISEVVNSPAPEFYMSARYVRDRLNILRRKKSLNF